MYAGFAPKKYGVNYQRRDSGHVGIYVGNGQIVHASTEQTGIKVSDATYRNILAIRRIF